MKKCFKCGQEKSLAYFYRHFAMSDGHLGKCKDCTKKDTRENYRDKRDYYREKNRYCNLSKEEKINRRSYAKNRNPIKIKCKNLCSNAIRDKRLIRTACEKCGNLFVEAHHDDYSKPLDVRWLCFKHHRELHGQIADSNPRLKSSAVLLNTP